MKIYLLIAITLSAVVASAYPFKDRKSPCQPLRLACTEAGYVLNDKREGNRLIKDCLVPLSKGQSAFNRHTGKMAVIPKFTHLSACRSNIHMSGKPTAGMRSARPVAAHPKRTVAL